MQHPLQSQPAAEARGRPGTPSLLRELNDRAALDLLLDVLAAEAGASA